MDNKLVICMVIFALTPLSYIINKIPIVGHGTFYHSAHFTLPGVDANGALGDSQMSTRS